MDPQVAMDVTIHSPDMHKMLELMQGQMTQNVGRLINTGGMGVAFVLGALVVGFLWLHSLSKKVNGR